jgi:hypothetical protein
MSRGLRGKVYEGSGRSLRRIAGPFVAAAMLATVVFGIQAPSSGEVPGNEVLNRALKIELGQAKPQKWEMPVSSGILYTLLDATGELDRRAEAARQGGTSFTPPTANTLGCQRQLGAAVRVNQDCSYRRQAEEVVAINPTNSRNLIAGQNDSRIGFNHCGYDYSFDGGKTWGDQIPPFWGFIMADGHTADACSDPTATFDANGNAYVGGVLFDIESPASAFVVAKSNAQFGGSFYHSPTTDPFQEFRTDPLGVVASDNDPTIAHDKEFIVADANPGSPKVNNVYGTWTRFEAETGQGVDANSPIYFSQSTDGGATWSEGIEISGANPEICTDFSGSRDPNACDQDQGSHPIVGPDGTIYVAFANGNTPEPGVNQVLFVKCPASADCTDPGSWTQPVKINDLIDNHPTGPSPEGCPPGRQCLPPNGYRVPEATSISISVDSQGFLYAVWADFRNGEPPCVGDAATASPPCDNDVFYSSSTDGGATWAPEVNVRPASKFGPTAQWQPWHAAAPDGRFLKVAFYDRSYGDCEFSGCNDITLATVRNPASASPSISYQRLTSSSMPNLTLANNPVQAGFLGDYMWVAIAANRAHVVWGDTRGRDGTVEEDVYFYRE